MPNDAVNPDLSKLDKNYQILTELHAEGDSRTYLARHLQLNRDVTITVTWLLDDDHNGLTHFAADAHLLTAMRHPNVTPVIEGIWLDERTFAIVRARVRGSTLEQEIAAGPAPIARVSTTIQQVESAIGWARRSGVVHRNVTARSIVFQQGNNRVLLSLEPRPLAADAMPGECDDARTLGRVASEMLSGHTEDDTDGSVAVIPPQLDPAVAEALEAVRSCDRTNAATSVAALLAALDPSVDRPRPSPVEHFSDREVPIIGAAPAANAAATRRAPAADRVVAPRSPARIPREPAVVAAPSSFGFNARLGSAIAVAAIVGVLALGVFRHQRGVDLAKSLATTDTTHQAAGEVAIGATRADSTVPTAAAPSLANTPQPVVATPLETRRPPITRSSDTVARRPLDVAPPTSTLPRDSAGATARTTMRDTAASAVVAESCASPQSEDQHKCLMAAIDRNDRELNSVFGRLVAALRRQAGVTASDPDPDTVEELRTVQRKWLEERDAACREVGERPLYARERSSCFAQQSSDRARELKRMLDAVPPA